MIKKAIIPVAGLGTRFLPATKAQPKEMLCVVDKPVIQYIVEEAVESGIEEIIFVTALGKRAIEDHFDRNFELEYRLEEKEKIEELKTIQKIGKLAKFAFVRQHKPLGDGHAILSALPFIDLHEPVAVLFGDDIIHGKIPALKQLMDVYEKTHSSVIALKNIKREEVKNYGVIDGSQIENNTWKISSFVEKPNPDESPTTLSVIGRYILTPEIYQKLSSQQPGKDGEIRLANVFSDVLSENQLLYGYEFEGTRYDCGNKLEFLKAQIELGLIHQDIGPHLKEYLDALH